MYHQRTNKEREAIYRRFLELKKEYPAMNVTQIAERMGMKRTALEYVIRWKNETH